MMSVATVLAERASERNNNFKVGTKRYRRLGKVVSHTSKIIEKICYPKGFPFAMFKGQSKKNRRN